MTDIQAAIRATIKSHAKELKDIALRIHRTPEEGLREVKACAWQTKLLKEWGFRVQSPFAGLSTAYKATFGRGKPTFCFMSEYDALPGIGHGCGHNLIAAAALGAGKALAETLRREKRPGTVVIMGTPAEEGEGGKVLMIAKDALKDIDAVLMAHPTSAYTLPDSGSSAVTRFQVAFRGQSAHAAGNPDKGRNALDAVMLVFQGINAWRQQLPETCRIHGIVNDGGEMPNIIPDYASCIFYLRAMEDDMLAMVEKRFRRIVEGAALMTDTTPEFTPCGMPYKARRPNQALNAAYVEAASAAGLKPTTPRRPPRASSDFGDVSHERPASHVYFAISHEELPGHSPQLCKAAGSTFGLNQMLLAAEAMGVAGWRYCTDEEFRRRVHAEFERTR